MNKSISWDSGTPEAASTQPTPESQARARFEKGLVEVFAELADLFGNPRSHGQIYGILFSSPDPLTMEEISNRVGISLGSASLGLRALESLGAIEREPRGRFAFYSARLELKTLINGFISQRLIPRLQNSQSTLESLKGLLQDMAETEATEAEWRLKRVTQWHARAARFLPLAEKILQSGNHFSKNQ